MLSTTARRVRVYQEVPAIRRSTKEHATAAMAVGTQVTSHGIGLRKLMIQSIPSVIQVKGWRTSMLAPNASRISMWMSGPQLRELRTSPSVLHGDRVWPELLVTGASK
jgi:hypothetical protein